MAKKKKRHRRPVAPPVHSAPGAPSHPQGAHAAAPPPARPTGAEPPAPMPTTVPRPQPAKRKKKTSRALGKKQRSWVPWVIGLVAVVALVGGIAGSKMSAHKSADRFDALASSAGCGKVQVVSNLSRQHSDGQRISYSTSPPAGGDHYSIPLPEGFYDKQLTTSTANPTTSTSIYRAMHSLEHGAVIIWFNKLPSSDVAKLKDSYDGEEKVIVAPYPKLRSGTKVALSAWGRLDYCGRMSTKVIDAFIARYRSANSAPEPFNPI